MGTCGQEGKPCSEYPQRISTRDISTVSVNRISNEYPRTIPWISNEPEIEYWGFPTTSVLLLHGGVAATILVESSTRIKTLKSGSDTPARLSIVSRVCLKCPRIILYACSNHVYIHALVWLCVSGRPEPRIQSPPPPLFKFNHVYKTVCHLHAPHSITCIFCPAEVSLKHCDCVGNCAEKVYLQVHWGWRTLDVWTRTEPIAFNVRPDKIHRGSY